MRKHTDLMSVCVCLTLLFTTYTSYAINFLKGNPIVQLGGYWSSQGTGQTIGIGNAQDLYFDVTHGNGRNGALGVGYTVKTMTYNTWQLSHGINAFYLAKTSVNGGITLEKQQTDNPKKRIPIERSFSYSYSVTHYPVYIMTKLQLIPETLPYSVNLDLGLGPNFISTSNFTDFYTGIFTTKLPSLFTGKSSVTYSLTAGLSLAVNAMNAFPLECGYRFFYLGKGTFSPAAPEIQNNLSTGNNYGNAILCAMSF